MPHILTGAPGAGKTVILRGLERAGLPVVEEAATDVIAWQQALGVAEPWTDPAFINDILSLQILRQDRAPPDAILDRSPICTLALARFLGFDPPERLLAEVARTTQAQSVGRRPCVLFVESLPTIVNTPARRIDLSEALRFGALHAETYRALGFDLIPIPPAPVPERVAMVLDRLP